MTTVKFKNFTRLTEDEKKLVLSWRNSDRIRLKMNNQNIISQEDHFRYIESLKHRNDRKYWLFMIDDIPVGVVDAVDIKEDGSCVGGYYMGNTSYRGYGLLLDYIYMDAFFSKPENRNARNRGNILKNNEKLYKMYKEFFHIKDEKETDTEWFFYHDYETWSKSRDNLKKIVYDAFDITEVQWLE